jgi:CRP-like cAMP-binding protein
MQALTDCELYTIDKNNYDALGNNIPEWHKLEKLFLAKCFIILEERVNSHLFMTAEERYNQLLAISSELFNQVPLQYLASMLGMTPETLNSAPLYASDLCDTKS